MILAACGLQREARLIARAGMIAVAGGGDAVRLERDLEAAVTGRRMVVLSIGIAGALSPRLQVGEMVIGGNTPSPKSLRRPGLDPGSRFPPSEKAGPRVKPRATELGLIERLKAILPTAHIGAIVGQDLPAATLEDKRHLHTTTGALAVDMESHIAARIAERHGLPFAAIRVVSDDAGRTLPPAALIGMRPDGGMALGAVLASIGQNPRQLPALIRTGIDAERAFRSLRRALRALEADGIGQLDLGEFRLDV